MKTIIYAQLTSSEDFMRIFSSNLGGLCFADISWCIDIQQRFRHKGRLSLSMFFQREVSRFPNF